jgi:hypothetical protein
MSPRARIASTALMWTAIVSSLAVLKADGHTAPWIPVALIGAGLVGAVAIARFRTGPVLEPVPAESEEPERQRSPVP